MAMIVKAYIIGWVVLVAAILFNVVVQKLGIMGWYDFLNGLVSDGRGIFRRVRFIDHLWLWLLYPLLLGFSARAGSQLADFLTR
jgi:hypothetical protein